MNKDSTKKNIYSTIIIGLGGIGLNYDLKLDKDKYVYTHSNAISSHPHFELKGGVDKNDNMCKVFTQHYSIKSFESIKVALAEIKPEVIIIATSTNSHLKVIREICKYHKPLAILCEKPMGGSILQGKEIIKICNNIGIHLYVNYVRSCLPGGMDVKSRIQNNLIKGPIKCVVWYSKGLKHNGAHFINLMEGWFGKCLQVKKINKGRETGAFGQEVSVLLEFENCEVILIPALEEFYSHYTIEIVSTTGRLYWNKSTIDWNEVINDDLLDGYKKLSTKTEEILIGIDRYQFYVLDQLFCALQGGVSNICTGMQALETHNTIDRIERSR
jgi:predicted dehydrogenase